jgi:hypothetical protein
MDTDKIRRPKSEIRKKSEGRNSKSALFGLAGLMFCKPHGQLHLEIDKKRRNMERLDDWQDLGLPGALSPHPPPPAPSHEPKMVARTPHPGPLPIGSEDSADAEREKRSPRLGDLLSRVVQGFNA